MKLLLLLICFLFPGFALAQSDTIPALLAEDCSNGIDDDGDGYIDCYDIDCQCFGPPGCSMQLPPNLDISIQLAWKAESFPVSVSGIGIVGNMDPQTDSIPEIIAVGSNGPNNTWDIRFFRGDGSNANSSDSLKLVDRMSNLGEPLIGDVDGDGIPELILGEGDRYIRVYRNYTPGANPVMTHWITSTQKMQYGESRPMLADLDGDGTPEILIDNEIFIFDFTDPVNPKLRKVLDGGNNPSGKQYYSLGFNPISLMSSPAVADLLKPADCNGDPDCDGLEIAAGPVIYSVDLDTTDGDGFQLKIQRDLNFLESPDEFGDGYTAIADMNIDGTPDIVVLGRGKVGLDPSKLGVYVWNKNGLLDYMSISIQDSIWGRFYSMPMIANVFDDTKRGLAKDFPEIVFSTTTNLYCYNLHATNFPDLSIWWFLPSATLDHLSDGSVTAFDFNGDGISEIVWNNDQELRILYGGHFPFPAGVDANRNWATISLEQSNSGFTRYPVVADVDNDGQAEVIQMGGFNGSQGDHSSMVSVYETAGLPWPPCRSVWNQYNYNFVNVEDDLGIPIQQQELWKEFPAPGSGKRPLNMALGQPGPLNGTVLIPLADLNSEVDTFYCDLDSLRLRLRVCNNGSVTAPAGISLQWYQGDPTVLNAVPFGTPQLFPAAIKKDSCAFWNLALPLPPNGILVSIINDDGSLAGPIDLASDFPSTNLLECNYLDNLSSIQISYTTPNLNLGPDQLICKDAATLLTANPGFSRYRWQDGSTTAAFNAPGAGTYWVDAWDICGNPFSDTLRLLPIPTPALALGADRSICLGDSLTFSVAGFDQVDWVSAGVPVCSTCPSVTLIPSTDLTIQVVGQSGICYERDTIAIAVLPLPQIMGQVQETHCGNADGAIDLMVTSALPYQVQWSGGQTAPNLSGLPAATYTVTVTDQAGCTQSDSFAIAASTALVLNPAALTHILCFGEPSGSISASLNTGTAPFQFNWSTGPGGAVLNGLMAGNYSLTVTDDLGCTTEATYQLTEPAQLSLQSVVNGTSCVSTTADISLIPQGGTAPYVFAWNAGQTTPVLNNLPPGSYSVTLTDANACETTQTFDIQPGGAPIISNTVLSPALCFGDNTGAISMNVSLGVPPYQYNWSTGATTANLNTLSAGNYAVTTSDTYGCTATAQFTLTDPPALQLQSTVDSSSCTSLTGDITVAPQGGTSPYTYLWNGGQTTPFLNDLPPGNYLLTVTDDHGCTNTQTFEIQPGGSPQISDSLLTPVRCFGENNGSLTVAVQLGFPPYQFNWSTGPGTGTLQNLVAGMYSVTIVDAKGCTGTAQFSIPQPNAVSLTASIDSTSCTSSTGNISVAGQGGTAPFTYNWDNGAITPAIANLNPGAYTVTISDSNTCTTTQTFTLAPGGAPVVTDSQVLPVSCSGEASGQISVDITGGVPPYQFQWSNGSNSNLVDQLPAGNYAVTATGANGCFTSMQFSVPEPALLSLGANLDNTSCISTTGNISVFAQGGTAPYVYLWNGGQTTATLNNLPPGNYSATTTDSNACSTSSTYSILPGGAPALMDSTVVPATCFGASNGEISVQVSGGAMPYSYQWSSGQSSAVLNNLSAGPYQLTISDVNACTSVVSFVVESPATIQTTLSLSLDTCSQSTGTIGLNPIGGTAPYTFLWSDGAVEKDRSDLPAGVYQVTLSDAQGCTFTQVAEVQKIDLYPAFSLANDTINCDHPVVTLSPNPSPASWDFQWQSPDGSVFQGPVQSFSQAGQYQLSVVNELGCSVLQLLDIPIDTLHPLALADAETLFIPCDQTLATLDGSGSASGAFFNAHWYQENNGQVIWDTLSPVAQTGSSGDFILQVTDLRNGCSGYDTVQVVVSLPITAVDIQLDSISCFGMEDGKIRVETVSGGLAPYTYSLDNQTFSPITSFAGLEAGIYSLVVKDANGCTWESGPMQLEAPPPLTLNLIASDTRIEQGEAVELQALVQPANTVLSQIQWLPAAYFSLPASLIETVHPTETTLFQIEIEDPHGCTASDTLRIRVRREAIYVPNVFHPGSSDNSQFTVFAAKDIQEVQLMRVYDRWGELLFEKRHFPPNDPDQGWDGSYRGNPMGPGVYIYYVVAAIIDGRTVELAGNVTVVR